MAKQKLIKRIDTIDGPLQIDYNALANLPEIATPDDLRALENTIGYAATDPDKTFAEVIDETFAKKDVVKNLQEQVALILNNPDSEGKINSVVEFIAFIEEHGEIAEGMLGDIAQLKADLAALVANTIPESAINEALAGIRDSLNNFENSLGFGTHEDKTVAEVLDETYAKKTELEEALKDLPTGGVSSWNDLEDKPFGEELIESIEWDNNPEGRYSVTIGGTVYTHFSDITFSDPATELIGSHLVTNHSTQDDMDLDVIIDGTQYGITQMPGADLMWFVYTLVFVPEDNYTVTSGESSATFEKKGIYAMGTVWESIKLTFANPVGEIKTLDEQFIPDTIARVSDLQVLQDALGAYITDINALIGGDE